MRTRSASTLFLLLVFLSAGVVCAYAQKDDASDDGLPSTAELIKNADDQWNAVVTQNSTSPSQLKSEAKAEELSAQAAQEESAAPVHAAAVEEPESQEAAIEAEMPSLYKRTQWQFGVESSYLEYQEPTLQVREKGPYYGIYMSVDSRPPQMRDWGFNVLHFDTHLDVGSVDYKSPSGTASAIQDIMFEPRIWMGTDFTLFGNTRFTPYLGLGYRSLTDYFGSESGGYDRFSQYIYLPLGFEVLRDLRPGWQIQFNAEYDFLLAGWQTSYLSQADAAFPDLRNKQSHGYGVKLSLDLIKKLKNVDLVFSPYYRYWNIQQSSTSSAPLRDSSGLAIVGYEPANNSNEVGLKVGVRF